MVSSSQKRTAIKAYYKKKICLIGGLEHIKDKFQEKVSDRSLSLDNKKTIGVNISKFTDHQHFDYFLWNIYCGIEKSFIRSTYYSGAEAVIVLISEDNVEQILQYYREIVTRLPVITIIFCIVLKYKTIPEITSAYFNTKSFNTLFRSQRFRIHEIEQPDQIFSQIRSAFLEDITNGEFNDNFIINFISLEKIVENGRGEIPYICDKYVEPAYDQSTSSRRLNTDILKYYLTKLALPFEFIDSDWIVINNETFGDFSIFLRNGEVYLTPHQCLKCEEKDCPKKKRTRNFICIQAETKGWSNVRGLYQKELLVLSKIITLKNANKHNLPKSILSQIENILPCVKNCI